MRHPALLSIFTLSLAACSDGAPSPAPRVPDTLDASSVDVGTPEAAVATDTLPPNDALPQNDASVSTDASSPDAALLDVTPVDRPGAEAAVDVAVADAGASVDAPSSGAVQYGRCGGTWAMCYSGPSTAVGVGTCDWGRARCTGGVAGGACIGDVVPIEEQCRNRLDDDCDGQVDEGCASPMPTCASPRVDDPSGLHVIYGNYEGGALVLDVDRPIDQVGVITYQPATLRLVGAHSGRVRHVVFVSFTGTSGMVYGAPPGMMIERVRAESVGLPPAGIPCVADRNSLDPRHDWRLHGMQIETFFAGRFGTSRMLSRYGYNEWTDAPIPLSRGGCCDG